MIICIIIIMDVCKCILILKFLNIKLILEILDNNIINRQNYVNNNVGNREWRELLNFEIV